MFICLLIKLVHGGFLDHEGYNKGANLPLMEYIIPSSYTLRFLASIWLWSSSFYVMQLLFYFCLFFVH